MTCTGYVAPSAAQKLVAAAAGRSRVGVTHAYHMGCYASMPAVRMAAGYLACCAERVAARPGASTSCTPRPAPCISIPAGHQPEQLVVQSLFADGHIRYSVRPDARARAWPGFPGRHEEAWCPAPWGPWAGPWATAACS